MKKFIFTLAALMFFSLSAHAFNYNSNCPSNEFGGRPLVNPAPTLNGSAKAYQDRLDAENYRRMNSVNINHRNYNNASNNTSPRKARKHGSAANKNK